MTSVDVVAALPRLRFDLRELAGAVGDLGVFVPIAVAMIVVNGLSATAVMVPAGLLYIVAGYVYRVPVPVQPLKAFGAIAIALHLGPDEIAAGSILMGATFVVLSATGALDRVARVFPVVLVRAVQLSVGLLFLKIAFGLVSAPPMAFVDHQRPAWYLIGGSLVVVVLAVVFRRYAISLVLVTVAAVSVVVLGPGLPALGPSALHLPHLTVAVFASAALSLALPQIPLTFANSCLGTEEAARSYFGAAASRVRAGRLAMTLGIANLAAGAICGMPVCHGAGGMTAHRAFGARTGGAPIMIGGVLVAVGLGAGAGLGIALGGFPLPILAGLLTVAGFFHLALLRDLRRPGDWAVAVVVGLVGAATNLAVALAGGLLLWWALVAFRGSRPGRDEPSRLVEPDGKPIST